MYFLYHILPSNVIICGFYQKLLNSEWLTDHLVRAEWFKYPKNERIGSIAFRNNRTFKNRSSKSEVTNYYFYLPRKYVSLKIFVMIMKVVISLPYLRGGYMNLKLPRTSPRGATDLKTWILTVLGWL